MKRNRSKLPTLSASCVPNGVPGASRLMSYPFTSILQRPSSEHDICKIADSLLHKAGVVGKLPTPVEELIACEGVEYVTNSEVYKEQFLASLNRKAREAFHTTWNKIRGIADLRDR